jgi:uncharacterized SAM-binding protein YcdF (DUF218 family)
VERRRSRWGVALLVVHLLIVLTGLPLFVWPDLPPLPEKADAIIELGGPGDRDGAALELARQGRAPVLVQSTTAKEAGTQSCLPPVPGVTIMCFHADPNTTEGEGRAIAALAEQHHWSSVILVTSRDHAWRARMLVSRCFPGQVYVSMTPLRWFEWPYQFGYQWAATVKALTFDRDC